MQGKLCLSLDAGDKCIARPALEAILFLSPGIRQIMQSVAAAVLDKLEEIRIRVEKPLTIVSAGRQYFIGPGGLVMENNEGAYRITPDDIGRSMNIISGASIYALEEELKRGYVTIAGGHRIGLTGRAVLEDGEIKTLKYISGLNIRISREVPGAADKMIHHIVDRRSGNIYHTMIFSPPGCGKTTVLRDVVRQLSNGIPGLLFPGVNVGLVDERSELAGCHQGIPQRDVGLRTDVLDACPKAQGMLMLLRAMSPAVIATDEIGRREDVEALEEVLNAGVKVVFTVHGSSMAELAARPGLDYLFKMKMVQRFVLLGRSKGVGTVERVFTSAKEGGVDLGC